ncbi:uncharacterized protein LOC106648523 [Trichogramma pretiosum]|uniref:uncharacterized protein LOC106648523 n=1 Tax=Trichogramma pretiosum TaxID=7493 RepID=UPI000C71C7BC|nr:uncharacterized protein LOC106648523 [Trichogramma pretiosum]
MEKKKAEEEKSYNTKVTRCCQNADPMRRFRDFRDSQIPKDFERQREETWDVSSLRSEGKVRATKPEADVAPASTRSQGTGGGGNDSGRESLKLPGDKSFELQQRLRSANASVEHPSLRQLINDRRRKKRRRGKNWPMSENSVDVKKDQRGAARKHQQHSTGKSREERRRRRRNRKRARSRIRLEQSGGGGRVARGRGRATRKWRDEPMARLIKLLDEQKAADEEARFLSENPLNLSSTRTVDVVGTTKITEQQQKQPRASHSNDYEIRLTTETRILEPPEPTTAHLYQAEHEFSRNLERELSAHGQMFDAAAEEEEAQDEHEEEEEEEEEEQQPRFDEQTKRTAVKASYDPERMLGYSRTDEDLPILDMENEVLQRTIKDYNAYMSSSIARAALVAKNEDSSRRDFYDQEGDNERHDEEVEVEEQEQQQEEEEEEEDEDEARGDLSCINGTFLPAPSVRYALIKYLKSSRPGHEYLEADYECEPGYVLDSSGVAAGGRLLCHERRWLGRLPRCLYRGDEASCAELGCQQLCRIVAGRATCLCHEGYRLLEDGRDCRDIDECSEDGAEGRGPCEDTCRNTEGGFECGCDGRPGTRLGPDNRTCQRNEPLESCGPDNAGCSHTCLASMGRVFCLCPDGFVLQDDWKTCQDVDECAVPYLQTELCRYGCINTPGSYRCAPPPPLDVVHAQMMTMTKQTSSSSSPPAPVAAASPHRGDSSCLLGYRLGEDRNCLDLDECSIDNGGCQEICENTEGSYFCACEGDERVLAPDMKTCVVAEKRFQELEDAAAARMRQQKQKQQRHSCSALNPVGGRGYLMCTSDLTTTTTTTTTGASVAALDADGEGAINGQQQQQAIKPGTKCYLKCPLGYELHGEYELTCQADGTWDGPKHGECLRYSKPRLDCPADVKAELPPGRDEAFVTYEQPSTDLDWFRYVHSKPSWGTRLEANLKLGRHEITFYARHPVSKKQTTCTLNITVQEGQAPKVNGCPSDIQVTGKNGSAITWIEPVFTDNVKVTRVTSNESPGQTFSIGGHKVEYEASDEAGWTTKCIFTVVLRPI